MRLEWLPAAINDLAGIREFITEDNPSAAQRVAQVILDTIDYLRDHPGIGRTGRIAGTRELVIPSIPYIVPYRVKGEVIELLGVLHTAREWPKEFNTGT